MKCLACGKKFKEGQPVLNVGYYVTNYSRGDFVSNGENTYVHLACVVNKEEK